MVIKGSRGRPSKTIVRKLQGLAWCNALKIRSNGLEFADLERQLLPEAIRIKDGQEVRPKLIDKYFSGTYTPKNNANRVGSFNLIDRTDTKFPGTSFWYNNPMWDFMDIHELSLRKIHLLMISIKISNSNKFFIKPNPNKEEFQRSSWSQVKDIKEVGNERSHEAFSFLLGIMRESIIRLNAIEHFQACGRLRKLVPVIWNTPELRPLVGEIFDYLEHTYFSVIYTTSGFSEMYLSKTWRDLHPKIANQYPETFYDKPTLLQPFLELIKE